MRIGYSIWIGLIYGLLVSPKSEAAGWGRVPLPKSQTLEEPLLEKGPPVVIPVTPDTELILIQGYTAHTLTADLEKMIKQYYQEPQEPEEARKKICPNCTLCLCVICACIIVLLIGLIIFVDIYFKLDLHPSDAPMD